MKNDYNLGHQQEYWDFVISQKKNLPIETLAVGFLLTSLLKEGKIPLKELSTGFFIFLKELDSMGKLSLMSIPNLKRAEMLMVRAKRIVEGVVKGVPETKKMIQEIESILYED